MSLADSIRRIPVFKRGGGERPSTSRRMPIAGYDGLSVEEIHLELRQLSQTDLVVVEAYERKHAGRDEVTDRIIQLAADEPWKGYDDASTERVVEMLAESEVPAARRAKIYEAAHKARGEVLSGAVQRIGRG